MFGIQVPRSVVVESLDSIVLTGIFDKVLLIVQLFRRYNIGFDANIR